MRHPARTTAVLLWLLTLLALTTTPATAADGRPTPKQSSAPTPGPLTTDQFYDKLGIADVRTRYVVLVDTVYLKGAALEEVRTQLTTLLDAVSGKDEITLILFDREIRWTVPRLTRADVDALRPPDPAPQDDTIDLLKALDAAMTVLRDDLPQRAAIAVLASGKQPRPDTVAALRSRADSLLTETPLTVHPLPLFGSRDNWARHLEVVARVFPGALITGAWEPSGRPDLAQVRDDVLRHAAVNALDLDRMGRIVVEWPKKPVRLTPKDGKATVTFTLRSTMRKVPVWISDLRFTVDDDPVPITAKVPADKSTWGELKPGVATPVTVELTWKSDQYTTERRTVRLTGRLAVHAKVSTRWEPNLRALGIRTIPPPLNAKSTTVSGTGQVGIPEWVLKAAVAGAIGLAVIWAFRAARARARRRPKMEGWLVARTVDEEDQGTVIRELGPVPLAGQRSLSTEQLLPSGEGLVHVSPEFDHRGVVTGFHIMYEPYDEQMPNDEGVCGMDDKVVINGVEFVHRVRQPSRP